MKSNNKVFLSIVCLALTALSCQAFTGSGSETPAAPVTNESQGDVLFEDDFSSSNWGTGTDTDRSVEYVNEALQMTIFTKNFFVWSVGNDTNYDNTHIEVTVIINNTDLTTTFGIICRQQEASDSFYYFGITPEGQYAIAKAATSQKDVVLTNSGNWQISDFIKTNTVSYRLGADCGNGTLTLYVDGQTIDSVSDTTYTNGGVALFTWSGVDATTTNVVFDDFVIRELP